MSVSIYIYILNVLEARELVVKGRPKLSNCTFTASLGPFKSKRPRAASTDRGDAEIRSTVHSERSSRTCAWSQQASHRFLCPPRATQGIIFLTLSTLSRVLSRCTPVLMVTPRSVTVTV